MNDEDLQIEIKYLQIEKKIKLLSTCMRILVQVVSVLITPPHIYTT